MTCTTCGRENPPHLTFCQECGQRLGPRIAPPTPPIGMGVEEPPPLPPAFGGRSLHDTTFDPPRNDAFQDPPRAEGPRRCRVCDTANAPGLRYCTSCGSNLEPPAPLSARSFSPQPVQSAPTPHAPAPVVARRVEMSPQPAPVVDRSPAPVRVLDLGPAPSPEQRTCPRCRGTVEASAQFCKFCGAQLTESQPRLARSEPARANGVERAQRSASPAPSRPPTQSAAEALASARPPPVVTRGRLVLIAKSGADGPSYPIGDTLDIGRVEGQLIIGEDPYLSPRHARIAFSGGKLYLRDLGSTNGIFLRLAAARDMKKEVVNEARFGLEPRPNAGAYDEVAVPLQDQDLILVGQQVLRFDVLKDGETGLGPAVEHGTVLFGSPAAPRYARICQRTVEGVTRDVYYVRKVETVLGRESGDIVFTEDPFLSRRHAAIRILGSDRAPLPIDAKPSPNQATRFALVDLGSSNGTFLRVKNDVELAPGDQFRVGQQLFRVDADDPWTSSSGDGRQSG